MTSSSPSNAARRWCGSVATCSATGTAVGDRSPCALPTHRPPSRFPWQEGSLMTFFKKTMLYLGLGPDEEYEVYDEEPEPVDRSRESVTPVVRTSGRPT